MGKINYIHIYYFSLYKYISYIKYFYIRISFMQKFIFHILLYKKRHMKSLISSYLINKENKCALEKM